MVRCHEMTRWAKRFTSHCKKNPQPFSASDHHEVGYRAALGESQTDPESSKSGNGDLQHVREMTLRSA
jgi:hypothetical protein